MNEPSIAEMGGAPKGYNAAAFARDIAVFRPFLREAAPGTLLAGPGSVGEGATFVPPMTLIKSEDMLAATGPVFDVFSYHFYGAASSRCASMMPKGVTTAAEALSEEWLSRTESTEAFYASLRDKFDPGKPLWITETAQAACGGDSWASTYIDTFRYLDQLGRLAKKGVQVIAHNTLASSDYGLLDQNTLAPRPNYWAALLWRKLMGTTVLQAAASPDSRLHLYAHCLRNTPGGVALLAINADRSVAHAINLAAAAERYTLTAPVLLDTAVLLNDHELRLEDDGNAPPLAGVATPAGRLTLAPASITFLAFPDANNAACR